MSHSSCKVNMVKMEKSCESLTVFILNQQSFNTKKQRKMMLVDEADTFSACGWCLSVLIDCGTATPAGKTHQIFNDEHFSITTVLYMYYSLSVQYIVPVVFQASNVSLSRIQHITWQAQQWHKTNLWNSDALAKQKKKRTWKPLASVTLFYIIIYYT